MASKKLDFRKNLIHTDSAVGESERKQKLIALDESEVDPSDIDDSEEVEYYEKSKFIEQQPLVEVNRCYLPDFIAKIFERDFGEGEVEPFEERGCDRYLRWREEENNKQPHDSYKDSQFQYNPIAFFKSTKERKRPKNGQEKKYESNCHKIILKDDWRGRDWLQTRHFALMAPVTYVGGTTENKNARYLYAFAIDLDGVGVRQLNTLFTYMTRIWEGNPRKPVPVDGHLIIPIPNIIVNSGHGLHLYYTMRYPLAMFPENVKYLQAISKAMYEVVCYPQSNGESGTTKQEKLQSLGIYHAFRLPETNTKTLKRTKSTGDYVGSGVSIEAWITDAPHYTINDLMPWMWFAGSGIYEKLTPATIGQLEKGGQMMNPKRLTLQQAREKYGEEWYANRNKPKGRFVINRRLYDWWLEKMRNTKGVKEGHRYYCIMTLAAFAAKCDIPFDELKNDAYSLIVPFNKLTMEKEPFEEHDVKVALKAYSNPDVVRWSPEMLSSWTDIPMKRTKRNKRKQIQHLKMARYGQNLDDPDGEWRNKDGRPIATLDNSKEAVLVRDWMDEHPDSKNKSACARDCGLTRPTVTKWWNLIETGDVPKRKIDVEVEEVKKRLQPVPITPQVALSPSEMGTCILEHGKTVVEINMAKLFLPDAESPVSGYSIEQVREIVTTGKWQELGWSLCY